MDSLSTGCPPPKPGHIRFGTRFVEEDQSRRVEAALSALPDLARPGDVGTVLLAGTESLFFKVISIFTSTTWMACTEHFRPRASRNSLKLKSGFSFKRSPIFC